MSLIFSHRSHNLSSLYADHLRHRLHTYPIVSLVFTSIISPSIKLIEFTCNNSIKSDLLVLFVGCKILKKNKN